MLAIAGGPSSVWSADILNGKRSQSFNTGTCGAADPITNGGRYLYLQPNGGQRFSRFDLRNRVIEPWTYLGFPPGTPLVGGKLAMAWFFEAPPNSAFSPPC